MSYYTGYFFTLYGYGIKRAKISHAVGTSKLVKDVSYISARNLYWHNSSSKRWTYSSS